MQLIPSKDQNIPSCMPIKRIKTMKDVKCSCFHILVALTMILAMASCSSQKPTGNQNPDQNVSAGVSTNGSPASSGTEQFSVEITPKDATRRTNMMLIAKGFNISDAKIEWLADGVPISGANAYILSAASIKKGSVIKAKLNVKGREISSNEIVIKNSPPEITGARFKPSGNALGVDVTAEDADGDNVTLTYAWSVNEKSAGADKIIGTQVKRGDKISVRITPSDGESEGRTIILSSAAHNMPPVLSDQRDIKFYGSLWTCQLKAIDHDGDPVTFVVKSGPQGMTIDPNTGLLTWQVPGDYKGKTSCVVALKDIHGAESSYTLDVDIGR